jgi:hypothetical protein
VTALSGRRLFCVRDAETPVFDSRTSPPWPASASTPSRTCAPACRAAHAWPCASPQATGKQLGQVDHIFPGGWRFLLGLEHSFGVAGFDLLFDNPHDRMLELEKPGVAIASTTQARGLSAAAHDLKLLLPRCRDDAMREVQSDRLI